MGSISSYLSQILGMPAGSTTFCEEFYKPVQFKKGDFALRQGEICPGTFFVEKGLLRMYSIDSQGRDHIIQFAPEQWLIGDRGSIYFGRDSRYFIDAVEDTSAILLPKDFFNKISYKYPAAIEKNEQLLQRHIESLQTRVNSLLAENAGERYMAFIKTYPDLLLRVPQWMVASYLGITPESLSRVRKDLAKKNFKN